MQCYNTLFSSSDRILLHFFFVFMFLSTFQKRLNRSFVPICFKSLEMFHECLWSFCTWAHIHSQKSEHVCEHHMHKKIRIDFGRWRLALKTRVQRRIVPACVFGLNRLFFFFCLIPLYTIHSTHIAVFDCVRSDSFFSFLLIFFSLFDFVDFDLVKRLFE